ncbi:MAG: hypothetical protein WDO18_10500 [Acidobacteriota bacterium]
MNQIITAIFPDMGKAVSNDVFERSAYRGYTFVMEAGDWSFVVGGGTQCNDWADASEVANKKRKVESRVLKLSIVQIEVVKNDKYSNSRASLAYRIAHVKHRSSFQEFLLVPAGGRPPQRRKWRGSVMLDRPRRVLYEPEEHALTNLSTSVGPINALLLGCLAAHGDHNKSTRL